MLAAARRWQDESLDSAQTKAMLRLQRRLVAYGWLKVALISSFGQTPGMALLELRLIRVDGGQVGATRAFAHVFGFDPLINTLCTPLRAVGPLAQGGALFALGISNSAAALADQAHRTLWNRLLATQVVRA